MLKIENIDKIVGLEYGRYRIHSVKDFSTSYSFAVLDTDEMRYFRIDLMKKRSSESGLFQLRYSPTRFVDTTDSVIENRQILFEDIIELVAKHRKPIKAKRC